MIVFLFLGIGIFAIPKPFETMGFGTLFCTILNLNIARFLNIFFVTGLVNWQRTPESKINFKTQFVMWFSGLRGAMAYALALQASQQIENGNVILVTTLVYSLITILGIATFLHPILQKMDVQNKPKDQAALALEEAETDNCSNRLKKSLSDFNNYQFSPLFIKDYRQIEDRVHERSQSFAVMNISDALTTEMRE